MLIRAAAWLLLVFAGSLPQTGDALATSETAPPIVATVPTDTVPTDSGPTDSTYDFWPEDRNISDCVGTLPKPGCGSEARGGWAQTAVFGAIVLGIAFIAWRIVTSAGQVRPAAPTDATAASTTASTTGEREPGASS